VRSIEGKNFLREEMLLRINSLLVTGKAKSVYFTEFVVQ
jgi:flagellar basal body-associated protein FliL